MSVGRFIVSSSTSSSSKLSSKQLLEAKISSSYDPSGHPMILDTWVLNITLLPCKVLHS